MGTLKKFLENAGCEIEVEMDELRLDLKMMETRKVLVEIPDRVYGQCQDLV